MSQSKNSERDLLESPKIGRNRLQFKNGNGCNLFCHGYYFFLSAIVWIPKGITRSSANNGMSSTFQKTKFQKWLSIDPLQSIFFFSRAHLQALHFPSVSKSMRGRVDIERQLEHQRSVL